MVRRMNGLQLQRRIHKKTVEGTMTEDGESGQRQQSQKQARSAVVLECVYFLQEEARAM